MIHNITSQLKPNSITIIGEIHQHPESINLFQELIKSYLKKNTCLTIALEINSDQQEIIEQVKQGRAVVSDIEISSIIDHAALRNMIADLVKQQRNGVCLNIIALDAGNDVEMRRDEWMALKLTDQVGTTPILVLLGGLHTLKKVNWDLSMAKGLPFVAEILNRQGDHVNSYIQNFPDAECNYGQHLQNRLVSAEAKEALDVLNNSYFSLLNAFDPVSAVEVVDGVIVWGCSS